jgi:predicted dehydrogenase
MNFLVVGLGSMGKRRVRCLQSLNYKNITGYDINPRRRFEAKKKYKIEICENFSDFINNKKNELSALIISTSPDFHMKYAYEAFKKNIPCFIEASVTNAEKIKKLSALCLKKKRLVFPSCTMLFNDSIKIIKNILKKKLIGKVYFAKYHVGQYLPDWHPWESIKNFYVGKKETNGCKELVPFELTWINNFFGDPTILKTTKNKFSNLDINFNDFYDFNLKYPKNIFFNITIEILSRPIATRELIIVGSKGKIILSFDQKCIKFKNINMKEFKIFPFNSGKVIKGYINSEKPYISEVKSFINAVKKRNIKLFPNSLSKDYKILKLTSRLIN